MSSREKDRIKFHSTNDLSIGWYVEKIENYIFKSKQNISINDFFEVYNIELYFSNDLYPKIWSDNEKIQYTKKIQNIYKKWKEEIFIGYINDNNFQTVFNELDFEYQNNFWKLFSDYSIYKNIGKDVFKDFLKNQPRQISNVLYHKKIVVFFNIVIKEFLMQYENAAQIIIDYEEEKNIFLPKSLKNEDKEEIIKKYLSLNTPQGLNYSRFIKNVKDSSSLKLSDKTRLLAKKKYEELSKALFKNRSGVGISLSIYINKEQKELIKEEYSEFKYEISIGEKYLKGLKEDIDLFELFESSFIDKGLINLIAKENDGSIWSAILLKSRTEYAPNSHMFSFLESNALLIIKVISEYLSNEGNSIEEYINSFVKYLNIHIQPNELNFIAPSKNASYLEKTRHLISEFEAILKQYSLLTKEGEIDYELVQISTKPTPFGEIKSRKSKKYIYSKNDKLDEKKNIFFSNQISLLPNRKKSDTLYKLFTIEKIKLVDFKEYQKPHIEKLIEDEYLRIDKLENIVINKPYMMHVLYALYNDNVINYNHCNYYPRKEIDKLIQDEQLMVENKLFTKDEVSYLNFFMNEKEFTDGYKLHNRYAHGANTFSKDEQEQDYLRILKMIILVLLKIEDDILDI